MADVAFSINMLLFAKYAAWQMESCSEVLKRKAQKGFIDFLPVL